MPVKTCYYYKLLVLYLSIGARVRKGQESSKLLEGLINGYVNSKSLSQLCTVCYSGLVLTLGRRGQKWDGPSLSLELEEGSSRTRKEMKNFFKKHDSSLVTALNSVLED